MDATTSGLVGVVVGGVLVGVITIVNTLLNRRNLREAIGNEREERQMADLRAWRDRSTPALAHTRNLLTTYHASFPKTVALEARHFDGGARSGYVERIAREIDERSRAVSDLLTELASGHPSRAVRDLAEEVRTLVLRHCAELRDQLLHNPQGTYDFRPDHDRAREVLVELTNALHATTGGPADPLSVILDR